MGRRAHVFPGVFDLRGSGCDLRKRETEPFDSGVKACAELAVFWRKCFRDLTLKITFGQCCKVILQHLYNSFGLFLACVCDVLRCFCQLRLHTCVLCFYCHGLLCRGAFEQTEQQYACFQKNDCSMQHCSLKVFCVGSIRKHQRRHQDAERDMVQRHQECGEDQGAGV